MEKKRWSLIFIGLCLALVFSVSSVEAQQHHLCEAFLFCDQDGDGIFRDHQRCDHCDPPLDPNDHVCDPGGPTGENCSEPEPEPTGTLKICHFMETLIHCEISTGVFIGGGALKIQNDQATIDDHLAHGDCIEEGIDWITPRKNNNEAGFRCPNHCIALPVGQVTCDP